MAKVFLDDFHLGYITKSLKETLEPTVLLIYKKKKKEKWEPPNTDFNPVLRGKVSLLEIEAILKAACRCQAIKMAIWTLHTYTEPLHFFAREKGCLKWIRSIMGQKQRFFLTSQQKPDSPTQKKWAPPLLLLLSNLIIQIIFVLTYYLWLYCRQCARQSQACKFQPGYKWGPKMRTKWLSLSLSLSHKGGGQVCKAHIVEKLHQNVADHILPLSSPWHYMWRKTTKKLLPSLMEN